MGAYVFCFRVVVVFFSVCNHVILEWIIGHYFLFLCSISFCMYLFDNFPSSSVDKFAFTRLESISSALALPVSRERHPKLIDNFSHVPKDSFLIYNCVPRKLKKHFFSIPNADIRHLLDSIVYALAVYATAFRSKLSLIFNSFLRLGSDIIYHLSLRSDIIFHFFLSDFPLFPKIEFSTYFEDRTSFSTFSFSEIGHRFPLFSDCTFHCDRDL